MSVMYAFHCTMSMRSMDLMMSMRSRDLILGLHVMCTTSPKLRRQHTTVRVWRERVGWISVANTTNLQVFEGMQIAKCSRMNLSDLISTQYSTNIEQYQQAAMQRLLV